jgi:hypothetical protein
VWAGNEPYLVSLFHYWPLPPSALAIGAFVPVPNLECPSKNFLLMRVQCHAGAPPRFHVGRRPLSHSSRSVLKKKS